MWRWPRRLRCWSWRRWNRDERWDIEELAPGAEPEAAASWAVHDVDADLRDEHDHDMLALGPWQV